MPALVAGIHVLKLRQSKDVDGRNKSGHDDDIRAISTYQTLARERQRFARVRGRAQRRHDLAGKQADRAQALV
jgi:hypothetical protein